MRKEEMTLSTELLALEAATFEVIDTVDPSMDMPLVTDGSCSSSCSCSSCCSCSTSSCCSSSTSTS